MSLFDEASSVIEGAISVPDEDRNVVSDVLSPQEYEELLPTKIPRSQ